jgi:hypothetical protein
MKSPRDIYLDNLDRIDKKLNYNPYRDKLGRFAEKGASMSIKESAKGTNPNYNKDSYKWSNNCQKCVPTYELRRRGYNVTASPHDENSSKLDTKPQILKLWNAKDWDYNQIQRKKDITGIERSKVMSRKDVAKNIKSIYAKAPMGARFQMVYRDTKRKNIGHTVIVEKTDKGALVIDPQINKIENSFSLENKSNVAILRIDNKKPNASLIKYVIN